MENKDKINQRGKRALWKYAGAVATFMVLGALGIQFMNQPETEELPVDNHPKTVLREELKQEYPSVLEKKETIVSSSSNKKKTVKPKKKNSNEDLLAETTVVEDKIAGIDEKEDTTKRAIENVTRSQIFACGGIWAYPSLILTPRYDYPNNNRKPETILKDVENLTRNGNYTYIVDGMRVSEETFRSLNQNDVESIDVYKHSDITQALYGNKDNQSRIALESR